MGRWFSLSVSAVLQRMKPAAGVVLALVLLGLAVPAHASRDVVQFANSVDVPSGMEVHDTVCFFCSVDVRGTVTGDIVVFFGSVHISGQAKHDVVNFFGDVRVDDDASIGHDLVNFFGGTHLGENSSVGQDTVVMFGSLHAASTASFHGDRVVQPAWLFWIPLLLIVALVRTVVWGVRYPRRYRYMRGY